MKEVQKFPALTQHQHTTARMSEKLRSVADTSEYVSTYDSEEPLHRLSPQAPSQRIEADYLLHQIPDTDELQDEEDQLPPTRAEHAQNPLESEAQYSQEAANANDLSSFDGPVFTEEEDQIVVFLQKRRVTWGDIAKQIGRTKKSTMLRYIEHLRDPSSPRKRKAKTSRTGDLEPEQGSLSQPVEVLHLNTYNGEPQQDRPADHQSRPLLQPDTAWYNYCKQPRTQAQDVQSEEHEYE